MPNRLFLLIAMVAAALLPSMAEDMTIAEYLNMVSGGRVTVHQPAALNLRLSAENGDTTNVAARDHARSDRNQRTAKGEALSKERSIKESFPEMGTYITYDAPSWRLRVGDFRTRDEAAARLAELREAFPGFAGEMIIVVDVINTLPQ